MKSCVVENHSLSEIEVSPSCDQAHLMFTSCSHPYTNLDILCTNVAMIHYYRTLGDEAPFFIGRVEWGALSTLDIESKCIAMGYPFRDSSGRCFNTGNEQMYFLHAEGAICCEIVCGSIDVLM